MIVIGERFLSAEHINSIDVQQISDELHTVIVNMTGSVSVFGQGRSDVMDKKMALELRRRIVIAIARYKSSDKPEIQYVDIPTYQEMHPKEESETQ